jgi:hypothetical protein
MTEEFNQIKIIALENTSFNKLEESYLSDLFIETVTKMVPTLSREAWFQLGDFSNSDIYEVNHLRMLIVRKTIYTQDQWHGIIHDNKKRFKIIASLEVNDNSTE